MKIILKRAAVLLGNSENLLTDVMEFYGEVVAIIVKKRRKDEAARAKEMKKWKKKPPRIIDADFDVARDLSGSGNPLKRVKDGNGIVTE